MAIKAKVSVLFVLFGLALVPLRSSAQTIVFVGSLTCGDTAGTLVTPDTSGISITQRGYKDDYQHRVPASGPVPQGLFDNGRGTLTGRDVTLTGGGSKDGVTLTTTLIASAAGTSYKIAGTQVFSGRGFAVPFTRTCTGSANRY